MRDKEQAMGLSPDFKDLDTDHDQDVHNEECLDSEDPKCDLCVECKEYFPLEDHIHLNCSKCNTEKIFKHSCEKKRLTRLTLEESMLICRMQRIKGADFSFWLFNFWKNKLGLVTYKVKDDPVKYSLTVHQISKGCDSTLNGY